MSRADAIATVVLEEFDKLPANRKPAIRTNGVREWVPLSGIVAELRDGRFVCLSLATGMKCLPASKLPMANGVGLHDWHAEVLAIRAFNRFILQECYDLLLGRENSEFLEFTPLHPNSLGEAGNDFQEHSGVPPFSWHKDVSLYMYCSEAPCGDASMELTIAAQEDASPWSISDNSIAETAGSKPLAGRAYFSRLGAVRRKPGRGDAPPTLSKSCSDKLALRQCTSLLCGLVSILVAPNPSLYLRSIVLPTSQYSEIGCRRCFSAEAGHGRMRPVVARNWPGGYAFVPFVVDTTDLEFSFSKRNFVDGQATSSSNLAVAWTQNGVNECLVGGVRRGSKAFAPLGASAVSRRMMWRLARDVAGILVAEHSGDKLFCPAHQLLLAKTYREVKAGTSLSAREEVKRDVGSIALQGWAKSGQDADWRLEE